ncbi:MAG TPA: TRAM domain-containing protein [Acidimicrobiales bacterium]|jgi:tRNA/tmRNA/rRNA uracil-C5-methylase (TrmA/RlmC/RlmD family)|nr:TRAM domain-containing protein [Acidimicrobiales bacterium]
MVSSSDKSTQGGAGGGPDHREASEQEGAIVELATGAIAAGGGCVSHAADGRVVFVRHALPGERVLAQVTAVSASFLRADAVEVLEPSPDRVSPPCPHAGPGRCGGCDWQHASLPAQRILKSALIAEQLRRLAGVDRAVAVEEVDGAPEGLGWRTRVRYSVDRSGHTGLRRHRSRSIEPVDECPIAAAAINRVGVGTVQWRGAHHLEVTASPDGGSAVVSVETGRTRLAGRPSVDAGLVVNGRTVRRPDRVRFEVLGNWFEVSTGVFWQVHPSAAALLTRTVLDGVAPVAGERVADLFSGAGLFTVPLAQAVGPRGSVVAVERSGRACSDAVRNAKDLHQVTFVRSDVSDSVVAGRIGAPDVIVLDPAREGAGLRLMRALVALDPSPRAVAYVSCDPASFARDLRVMLDAGWSLPSLRAFDLFPMTEHVELVGILSPPKPA